ncbi:MAG: PIN domain-containing protein [Promethearchaeota archaeon]
MKNKVYLDTGVLTLFLSRNCPPKVENLMQKINKGTIEAHVLAPVLSELFFHACKLDGIDSAKIAVNSLIEEYPFIIANLDKSLIMSTGILKCQHKNTLSYNDCMSIAYCLNNNIEFHTTEKNLRKIPSNTLQRLRIVKYQF